MLPDHLKISGSLLYLDSFEGLRARLSTGCLWLVLAAATMAFVARQAWRVKCQQAKVVWRPLFRVPGIFAVFG